MGRNAADRSGTLAPAAEVFLPPPFFVVSLFLCEAWPSGTVGGRMREEMPQLGTPC